MSTATTLERSLPLKKLSHLQDMVKNWVRRRSCTRKELESLVGHLEYTQQQSSDRAVFSFECQLFALLSLKRAHHHYISLMQARGLILRGGKCFCVSGMTSYLVFPTMIPSIDVIDASGASGYGAFYIYILHRCF